MDVRAKLQESLRSALEKARSLPPGPERSFWAFRADEDFPPRSIGSPDAFAGSDRLCIVCPETGLPPRAQAESVARWCAFLADVQGVRYLWCLSKVPQRLFEAACRVRGLEGLYIKWSGIDSLAPLAAATQLLHLHLGSSPAVRDLAPIARLRQLRWLELDNLKHVTDLGPLSGLSSLEGLGFTGAEGRRHTVASFAPLAQLGALRWLHLGSLHAADGSLRALAALTNLRWLGLGNFYPWEEFAWLAGQLPATACSGFSPAQDLGRLGVRCRQCGSGVRLTSGRPVRKLCPRCDADALAARTAAFDARKARSAAVRPG